MTTTTTLTNSFHSLRLFSVPSEPAQKQQQQQQQYVNTPALSTSASSISNKSGGSQTVNELSSPSSSSSSSSCSSGQSNSINAESWPAAVDALAQRLWDCGRSALSGLGSSGSSSSSGSNSGSNSDSSQKDAADGYANEVEVSDGEVEEPMTVLCDGPYVRVDFAPVKASEESTAEESQMVFVDNSDGRNTTKQQQQQQIHFHCYQPVSNPFKSLLRPSSTPPQNSSTASASASKNIKLHAHTPPPRPAPPPPPNTSSVATCLHCRRGNFLEFCFSKDHCQCQCHNDCPCKPCSEIRSSRIANSQEVPSYNNDTTTILPKDNLIRFRPFGTVDALRPVVNVAGKKKRSQREYDHAKMRVSKVWADEKRRLCSLPT